jgi:hypothetical protein
MHNNSIEMKKEDRASLSVSKETRDMVSAYIEKRQAKERYRVTHDVVIYEAINCLEQRDKKREHDGSV